MSELPIDSPVARPPFGVCGSVFEHWLSLRTDSPRPDNVPVRDQIDMLTLPIEALPWFFINEREGERYVNRLAGTSMINGVGFETKGRYLDEMMDPAIYPKRKVLFDVCLDNKVCVHYRAPLAAKDRGHVGFSRILFPVAARGAGPVDLVCGTMVFFSEDDISQSELVQMSTGLRQVFLQSYFDGAVWRDLRLKQK